MIVAMKIPDDWFNLFADDRIHASGKASEIQATLKSMAKWGYEFDTEPSLYGLWLICRKSPNVSPYKRAEPAPQ
jgi:hypothetical protein